MKKEDKVNKVIVMMNQWKYVLELTHYLIFKIEIVNPGVYRTVLKIYYPP